MKTTLPPTAHPDTYRFFREDAIAAIRTVTPTATDAEAIALASLALSYFSEVGELFTYADFPVLSKMLSEEAKQ